MRSSAATATAGPRAGAGASSERLRLCFLDFFFSFFSFFLRFLLSFFSRFRFFSSSLDDDDDDESDAIVLYATRTARAAAPELCLPCKLTIST